MKLPNPDLDILQTGAKGGVAPEDPNQEKDDTTEEKDTTAEEKDTTPKEPDEDLTDIFLELLKEAEKEDLDLRYKLVSVWKRNDYYFNNIQSIVFDDVARDFRSIDGILGELNKLSPAGDIKTINVYRAFAESLIAALSVALPSVTFPPDDAEDPDDIATAESYTRASELISKHTKAPLALIKALTILFNQGLVAAFNYRKEDPAYGTIRTAKNVKQKSVKLIDLRCAKCANLLESSIPAGTAEDGQINSSAANSTMTCPQCGYTGTPAPDVRLDNVDEVSEWEHTPKSMVGFDIFGPTHVKLPLYARKPEDVGYAILRLEDHIAKFKTVYSEFADDIAGGGGDLESYERWGRIPPEYFGTLPVNITTARYGYFRPWYYNVLSSENAAKLTAKYPKGLMVTVINDTVVDYGSESLDDRWTLSFDPRSNFLHAEPAGNALIPLQDSKTDLFNLGLQSIEYGIPETFANPKTLNLKKYGESAKSPGMISPALPPGPDKSLADGFFTVKTATLSNEYIEFDKSLDTLTQFVTGAFPSIFGGALGAGSKTATEYTESRSRALQRLQLTWIMVSYFWCDLISKCVAQYITNLKEDEKFSSKQNGKFINVWIRKAETAGKIGNIEPEISGQLPQSWSQKKDFIMNLLGMNIPQIAPILLHPCNTELVKQVTGMPDFYIPGENDRTKQYGEFYQLSQDKANGNMPSVPVDVDVDDHQVHMQVLKNILVGTLGVQLDVTNPAGYANCIAHYRQHEIALQAKTQAPAGGTAVGEPPQSATATTQG